MTIRIPLLAFAVAAALAAPAHADDIAPFAQSNSPEADASLYGESVMLPKKAAVCAERIAGYAPRFQRAYDAWRSDNAAHIDKGSRFMHESAARGGVDADAGMNKLGQAETDRLRKTTPELLARHCQLMLDTLAAPAN